MLALTAPLLLTGAVVLGMRHARPLPAATIERLVTAVQVIALAFVMACYVVQYRHIFRLEVSMTSDRTVYFRPITLLAAAGIAFALGSAMASERIGRIFARLTRERLLSQLAGLGVATLAAAVWLLSAVNFESTIANANEAIMHHLPFWLDEVFAVLDHRTPLVDFAAQYGSLLPYPLAGAMTLVGASIGVFSVAMSLISLMAMLAVYVTLRRVVRSSVTALLLFLPFLATSFFMMEGPLENRYAISNLFGTFPLRYAAPFLLLWLVARHLDAAFPRRIWPLFLVGGLTILNNADFGIPACGATVAALLWSSRRVTLSGLLRLAAGAALGLGLAYALVSIATLGRTGSLPHLDLLFRYARVWALAGWGTVPMTPTIGVSTIVYLTYVAAIGVATVRAAASAPDRLMTGLLAWSGIFGLGIGSYYIGRSHPQVLTNMFPAWALSITLLFVLSVRAIVRRQPRRPTLPEGACLFAFAVLVCSLPQMPTPWSQLDRLRVKGPPIYEHYFGEQFIGDHTRRGEAVAILAPLGHRTAYNLGITDVTPYTGSKSMPAINQVDHTLELLQAAGGRKVFFSIHEWPELHDWLIDHGYFVAALEQGGVVEFTRRS